MACIRKRSGETSHRRASRAFSSRKMGAIASHASCGRQWFSTTQDLLSDAPFSRLDFVSCRNVLIYLRPEVQDKVLSIFHFALREDGILVLGSSEAIGDLGDRFEPISKKQRVFR